VRTIVEAKPRCTVCGKFIPAEHPKRKSTLTCSDECRDTRELWRRTKKDAKQCRYCEHPASLAERARYKRWRRAEKLNPPPDFELSPEELAEREYLIANPKPKRERKPKAQIEEPDAE
jgi:predicted nucleic acid-binding Zn ribbon protein